MIGKNEELVLLSVLKCSGESTPADVYKRIVDVPNTKWRPAFGAVYTTLGRLAGKGLLSENIKSIENDKERKFYEITLQGRTALIEASQPYFALGGADLASI